MNSSGKRFYLIAAFVLGSVTPVMANQPPGPGVSLPQTLMLPLMALFTALGGAYSILRAEKKSRFGKAGKWLAIVVLFVFGFTHEGASLLVTCLFGAVALHRGVRMVRWGLKPPAPAAVPSPGVPGWRLISAGTMMSLVALYLMGSAVVFVNYWPDIYQRLQVTQLKRLLASEIAYGRKQKEQTGETRFYRIKPGDDSEWYTQELLHHGNVRLDFNPDEKHFTIYLLPYSKFPPSPYRFWTKQGSYRADETGQIRMVWAGRADEVCPADAPVVMKVEEEDIRKMTEDMNQR
jgi:hypothetical protein